jgi:hypothetical protein
MSTAKFNTWLNPDGTQNYKCRAWVNFNGTGTVAIRAAGNVSSITDNGTGDYTVNFTTAMPDANYAVSLCNANLTVSPNQGQTFIQNRSTTSLRTLTSNYGYASGDSDVITVSVFR